MSQGSHVKILLVEDDIWLGQLYRDVLQSDNLHVDIAQDASGALEALDNCSYDLLVLDMYLPGHSGLELLHEIASYQDTSTIPVIILSSIFKHDFAMSDQRWREYGVVEYLYKPETKPGILAAQVKKQLLTQSVVV